MLTKPIVFFFLLSIMAFSQQSFATDSFSVDCICAAQNGVVYGVIGDFDEYSRQNELLVFVSTPSSTVGQLFKKMTIESKCVDQVLCEIITNEPVTPINGPSRVEVLGWGIPKHKGRTAFVLRGLTAR